MIHQNPYSLSIIAAGRATASHIRRKISVTFAAQLASTSRTVGEVLSLLGNWGGASFACESANGLGQARQGSTPWQRDYLLRSGRDRQSRPIRARARSRRTSSSGKSSKLRMTRAATTSRPATARGSSITRTSNARVFGSMPVSGPLLVGAKTSR